MTPSQSKYKYNESIPLATILISKLLFFALFFTQPYFHKLQAIILNFLLQKLPFIPTLLGIVLWIL
jgi:hypothetical protein